MNINPQIQKDLDRLVPKAEQGRFVEGAVRKALSERESAHSSPVEIFVDGGSRGNPGSSGGGYVAFQKGKEVFRGSEYFGERTNNQAEYLALRAALRDAFDKFGDADLLIHMDSQLMAEQVSGNFRVKSEGLKPIYEEVMRILGQFKSFRVKHIPREQNKIADSLANRAMDSKR